jgi:membrane protein DedA with SNARE-associated domain
LLSTKDLDRAEHWFERYGSVSVLIGRVIPIVRSFISVPAGMAEMDRGRFAGLTTIGSAVWVALLAGLGYAAGSNWKHVSGDFHSAQYPIIAVVVLALAYAIWHRWRTVRRESAA